jgi:hypothetical protein
MDFESAEAIQGVFASDAYKALIPDRETGFSHIEILTTEPLTDQQPMRTAFLRCASSTHR